ncbi:MAG: HD-GYP domain-containing protein [Chloroflexi bacterium]|nr:HD-GYP domain-containing protein [Chloroflexota bacterium]
MLLTTIPVALVYLSLRNSLRLQVLTRDAVEKMADVIDRRDPYTAGHSIRVADLAARIAIEMGLPWEEVETIRAAARVHDLGKIEIDSIVLNKPGRLDDREWELMRRHPIVGAEIISRFPEFARGADYIRYHHERWDGKGYPYGLKGEEIPLGARIIAVADSYDAMTTDRPYRRALSRDVVVAELKRGAGVQWDPRVVAAFLRVLGEEESQSGTDAIPVAVT